MSENSELSRRELEILDLVSKGASNKEIARDLHISTNTVKVHLRNIFAKTETNSRTEAAMFAVSSGLVDVGSEGELVKGVQPGEIVTSESSGEVIEQRRRVNPWLLFAAFTAIIVVVSVIAFIIQSAGSSPAASASQPIVTGVPRWEEKAPLMMARKGLALAVHNNSIYAIAGQSSSGVSDVVERYDPEEDLWQVLLQKPIPVADISAAVVGGKIYIPGGQLSSGEVTDQLEIYDPLLDRWEKGAPLPVPLSGYALVAYEGKILLFGGWNGAAAEKGVYEYDPGSDQWVARSEMPTARAFPGIGISEGRIYVLGGFDGEKSLAVNEVYAPEAEGSDISPWVTGVPLPQPRYAMGVASMVDTLHVIGGVGDGEPSLPSLELPTGSPQWEIYENPFEGQWSSFGLAPIGTHLYLTGGEINGQPTANNLTYQAIYLINLPVVR